MYKSEKYVFLAILSPLWSMRPGKADYACYIIRQSEVKSHVSKLTQLFHYLPSFVPKQLCALAHLGCTRTAVTS